MTWPPPCCWPRAKPVLCAPAMNVRMWHHAATQRNLARLAARTASISSGRKKARWPAANGVMGRMAQVEADRREDRGRCSGRRRSPSLAATSSSPPGRPTSRSTRSACIANRSSGKQGYAIARAAAGASAHASRSFPGQRILAAAAWCVAACRGRDRRRRCWPPSDNALPADAAIFAAAVADWRAADIMRRPSSRSPPVRPPSSSLTENPDILKIVLPRAPDRPALVDPALRPRPAILAAKGAGEAPAPRAATGSWPTTSRPESGVFGGEENNNVSLVTPDGAGGLAAHEQGRCCSTQRLMSACGRWRWSPVNRICPVGARPWRLEIDVAVRRLPHGFEVPADLPDYQST